MASSRSSLEARSMVSVDCVQKNISEPALHKIDLSEDYIDLRRLQRNGVRQVVLLIFHGPALYFV